MIGNNSCGVHSVMAGKTDDNIEALEILSLRRPEDEGQARPATLNWSRSFETAAAGEKSTPASRNFATNIQISSVSAIPIFRGGCQVITSTSCCPKMVLMWPARWSGPKALVSPCWRRRVAWSSPPARVLLVIAYPDIYQCADHVPDVMAHKPIGLEGIDDLLVEYTRRRGINSEGLALLPEGGGWLLAQLEPTPSPHLKPRRPA